MKMSCLIIYSFVRSLILKQRIRKMRTAKECDIQNSRFFFLNPSRKAADRGCSRVLFAQKCSCFPRFTYKEIIFFQTNCPRLFFTLDLFSGVFSLS